MHTTNINKSLYEYIEKYPQLSSWLYFNTIEMAPYNASMLTGSDDLLEEYIDGSEQRQYICQIAFMQQYDTGTSTVNIDAMEEAQNFNEWLENQDELENYPDLGIDNIVQSIQGTTQIPEMSVDPEAQIARYTISLKLIYLRKKEEH